MPGLKRVEVLRPIAYVMRRLQVSRETVERLMRAGELPYIDLATHVESGRGQGTRAWRALRFKRSDVDDLIARRRVVKSEPPSAGESSPEPSPARALRVVPRRRAVIAVGELPGSSRYF